MTEGQQDELEDDDSFDVEALLEPEPMVAPPHWREPKIHPEIVAHGAHLARLAIEISRLERGRDGHGRPPIDCLDDAGMLLQKAFEIVPCTVNMSRPSREEHQEWVRGHIMADLRGRTVPRAVICSENKRASQAPKTRMRLTIGGKRVPYEWKAYVQVEKEGGLKALLFKHAMRMCFEDPVPRRRMCRLQRILAVWAFHHQRRNWNAEKRREWWLKRRERKRLAVEFRASALARLKEPQARAKKQEWEEKRKRSKRWRSIKAVSRHIDISWAKPLFQAAVESMPNELRWPTVEWRRAVVQAWQEASAKDFAARLLRSARAGQLSITDFKAIAITRKLYPPGGAQRRTSGRDLRNSGDKIRPSKN